MTGTTTEDSLEGKPEDKEKKDERTQMVVMSQTDGLLFQSLRRLLVYRRGGALRQGRIHMENQNLRDTRGSQSVRDLRVPRRLSFTPPVQIVFSKVFSLTGWQEE